MSDLIYDANFLVAFIDKNDKWHEKVVTIHNDIRAKGCGIIYFDCVANEVISVLGKRLEEKGRKEEFKKIMDRFKKVVPREKLSWIYPNIIRYYDEILSLMADSKGKLNFHDALIAVTAQEMALKYIVSLDQDFDEIKWLIRIKNAKDLDGIPDSKIVKKE